MKKTDENLKAAFAGESQANRRYLAFAKKAEEEGFMQVAKLFKAAAEAETVHALNHLRITGQILRCIIIITYYCKIIFSVMERSLISII